MKNLLKIIVLGLMLLPLRALAAPSQGLGSDTCRGPIYTASEVTRRAKIIESANLEIIYKGFGRNLRAHFIVDSVLCRSGRVTDIKVIEISPADITGFVVDALSQIRFKPAEMNWHTVSQRQRFEFRINDNGVKTSSPASTGERLVEDLDIMGNRRFTKDEILAWIRIRPGDSYSNEQIKKDFDGLLSTGYFDKLYTRVFTEEAPRGGIRVVFEVRELPVIFEVMFVGLNESEQSSINQALAERKVNVRSGSPFDEVQAKVASDIIKHFLETKRRLDVNVDLQVQSFLAANKVSLTFIVTNK